MVSDARSRGYAYVEGRVVRGIGTVGVSVLVDGAPVAALSISAILERMEPARRERIAAALLREAAGLGQAAPSGS
jgi:DNA-binding IclR family transcriptional regulator